MQLVCNPLFRAVLEWRAIAYRPAQAPGDHAQVASIARADARDHDRAATRVHEAPVRVARPLEGPAVRPGEAP